MSINKRLLRYAHSEGHTDLCYTEDGRQIITCGNDGDIRIWAGIDDNDPASVCVGEGAFSLAQKGDDIYVCNDDGRVEIFKYPDGERNGTLTRFTAPGTHITISKNEPIIVCVSEDFSVKVFKTPQDVDSITFSELQGPALGAAISPDEKFIAASCGDGKLYIWNIEEKKLVKSIDCVPKCNSFTSANVLCRVSFDPKSKYLAYPHLKEIVIASVDQFEKVYSFQGDENENVFSIVQYSPCGRFIAASTTKGNIYIWCSQPGSVPGVYKHEAKSNVCALAWNPESNGEICFCDRNGQIGSLEYTAGIESSLPSEIQDATVSMDQFEPEDENDDEDNENVVSLEKIKNQALGFRSASSTALSSRSASRCPSPFERPSSPPCTLQPPFQPGSTPVHLMQRFMSYNEVGIVRLHTEEDDMSSIDVQFHDATFYKNLFMKNLLNHTMASLSSSVLALACEIPSKLVCIPLKTGTKEWSMELTELEEILCVTASSNLVAIATNLRMLRVYSVFGTQLAVLSVPGPAVSITAFKNNIFVIYHACTAHSKDQNLAGMLVHINGTKITSNTMTIPITPQSTLMWIGFTDVGSISTYDSAGNLRICKIKSGAWIPACDTTAHAKGVSDTFFLVYVNESSQTLRVIHCRGSMYPATTPLPIVMELPMRVPMCEIETDKTQLEDKLFRMMHFETDEPEKAFKETAIKLFALACRNNLDDRAFEILEVLATPSLINIALKYANKLGRNRLVERLTELLKRLQGGESFTQNEQNTTVISRTLNRPNKIRSEPTTPLTETQNTVTSEIFPNSNNSLMDDSMTSTPSSFQNKSITMQKTPKRNPFLKNSNLLDNKRNPLSLTDSFPEEILLDDNKQNAKKENEKPQEKLVNHNGKDVEKESFSSWFAKEKSELEKQHSEMSSQDLVKFALKLYKKQATDKSEKRKADETNENSQKSKQAKLSAFAFSKT